MFKVLIFISYAHAGGALSTGHTVHVSGPEFPTLPRCEAWLDGDGLPWAVGHLVAQLPKIAKLDGTVSRVAIVCQDMNEQAMP